MVNFARNYLMENKDHSVYSRNIIDFVAVANEFCKYMEQASNFKGKDLLFILQRILPLLYLKGALLPLFEPYFEEGNDKFVTEENWNDIYKTLKHKFGSSDEFSEVFDEKFDLSGAPAVSSISENMADIYQDLKDFLLLYQTGTSEIMNDAVWECRLNFETLWGQKLVNSLRAIHHAVYSEKDEDKPDDEAKREDHEHHHCDDDCCSFKE